MAYGRRIEPEEVVLTRDGVLGDAKARNREGMVYVNGGDVQDDYFVHRDRQVVDGDMAVPICEDPRELLSSHVDVDWIDLDRGSHEAHRCEGLVLDEAEHAPGDEQRQDHVLPVAPSALLVELRRFLDVLLAALCYPVDHEAGDDGPRRETEEHVVMEQRPPYGVRRSLRVERQNKHSTSEPRRSFDIKIIKYVIRR